MNDAINRKDTIGAILSIGHIAELSDGDAVIRVSAVNYVLRNLPSAQPDHNELNLKCDGCNHHGKTTASCTLCARYYPDLYEKL